MLKSLQYFFKGHAFEFATYKSPWRSFTPRIIAINLDGSLDIKSPINLGFMHFGLVSNCQVCGKQVEAENLALPILEPDFNQEV